MEEGSVSSEQDSLRPRVSAEAVERQASACELPHHASRGSIRTSNEGRDGEATPGSEAGEQQEQRLLEDEGDGSVSQGPSPRSQPDEKNTTGPGAGVHRSQGSVSSVQKANQRLEALRSRYGLPPSEQLMDDYMCALRTSRMLHQGRLYVWDEHLCFSSKLFGYSKQICFPLEEVTELRKRTNLGFPNSIRVRLEGGRSYFFTSFLAREDAFRLINSLWQQCSSHGRAAAAAREAERSAGSALGSDAGADDEAQDSGGARREPQDDGASDGEQSEVGEGGGEEGGEEGDGGQRGGDDQELPPKVQALIKNSSVEFEALTDLQLQTVVDEHFSQANNEPAPPVDPEMKLATEFNLQCSPAEFWARFLSGESKFYVDFQKSRDDTNIKLTAWQRHRVVGMVRDLQFVTNVKAKMGPSTTLCHQTQRFAVYSGKHMVFETSQVQSDLPYGDCFTVETRWDVTPCEQGCHVAINVSVPFSKSTMFKKMIEKGVMDSCQESFQLWRQLAEKRLQEQAGLSRVKQQISSAHPRNLEEWEGILNKVDPPLKDAVRAMIPSHLSKGKLNASASGGTSSSASKGLARAASRQRISRRLGRGGSGRDASRRSSSSQSLQGAGAEEAEDGTRGSASSPEGPPSPALPEERRAAGPAVGRSQSTGGLMAALPVPLGTLLLALAAFAILGLQVATLLAVRQLSASCQR